MCASCLFGVSAHRKYVLKGIVFKLAEDIRLPVTAPPGPGQPKERWLYGETEASWELAAKGAGHDLNGTACFSLPSGSCFVGTQHLTTRLCWVSVCFAVVCRRDQLQLRVVCGAARGRGQKPPRSHAGQTDHFSGPTHFDVLFFAGVDRPLGLPVGSAASSLPCLWHVPLDSLRACARAV